ncbi:MAG: insulinase family protein [Elusimicrobia bacterium]|nr:insulinase family protein [Elusimicrobiota bacterium]
MKNIPGFFLSSYLAILTTVSFLYSAESNKLKNGVSVVFDSDSSADTTAIQIWISAGAANEDKNISGISHFIEHLIFKGTPTRTQKQIAPDIEKLGGIINAATSKDFTYFYAMVPSSYSIQAAEILTDAILNPLFPEEEIEKERRVILEEIKRKDDNPQSLLFDEFYSHAYLNFFRYTQRVIGTEETVSKLKRDDFLSFHKNFYTPKNIFVVVAGNFDKKKMLFFLKNSFGKLEKTKKRKEKIFTTDAGIGERPYKKTIKKDVSHSYIIMGFPAANIKSKDQYPLDVASYILGMGRASRLYKELVEETKLAYTVSVSFATHKGPGLFYVYVECSPENASAVSNKILIELNQLTFENVTDEELDRAKTLLMRDKLLQEQTPDGKAEELGFYAALGNKKITDNYTKNIKKVEGEDVKNVISKYLIFPNIPTVVISP